MWAQSRQARDYLVLRVLNVESKDNALQRLSGLPILLFGFITVLVGSHGGSPCAVACVGANNYNVGAVA